MPGKGCKSDPHQADVDKLGDLTSMGWKSPLDRRLTSRLGTGPFQFTGVEERNTPKSELFHLQNSHSALHLGKHQPTCQARRRLR